MGKLVTQRVEDVLLRGGKRCVDALMTTAMLISMEGVGGGAGLCLPLGRGSFRQGAGSR